MVRVCVKEEIVCICVVSIFPCQLLSSEKVGQCLSELGQQEFVLCYVLPRTRLWRATHSSTHCSHLLAFACEDHRDTWRLKHSMTSACKKHANACSSGSVYHVWDCLGRTYKLTILLNLFSFPDYWILTFLSRSSASHTDAQGSPEYLCETPDRQKACLMWFILWNCCGFV